VFTVAGQFERSSSFSQKCFQWLHYAGKQSLRG